MLSLDDIRKRLSEGRYVLSRHAFRRVIEKNLSSEMIRQAGRVSEIIEDYPNDKYGPSCLILGYTLPGTRLHVQVSRLDGLEVKIITLYVPDPLEWVNDRERKRPI